MFLKLLPALNSDAWDPKLIFIRADQICSVVQYNETTEIGLMSGKYALVSDKADEILKQIESARMTWVPQND